MAAASKTLDLRGDKTTGWAMVHRITCRARLGEGDNAHALIGGLLSNRTNANLWATHPPFQIDANLGMMAGVAEMLMQSHTGEIVLLPALPAAWQTGRFEGLVARGNFVVDAAWTDGRATRITVTSRNGGECRLAYPGIVNARIADESGAPVAARNESNDRISFPTVQGGGYTLRF